MRQVYVVSTPDMDTRHTKHHKSKKIIHQTNRIAPVRTYSIVKQTEDNSKACCNFAVNPIYGVPDEVISSVLTPAGSEQDHSDAYKCRRQRRNAITPADNHTYGTLWHQDNESSNDNISHEQVVDNSKCDEDINFKDKVRVCVTRVKDFHDTTLLGVCAFSIILTVIIALLGFTGMMTKRNYFSMSNLDLFSLVTAPTITNILLASMSFKLAYSKSNKLPIILLLVITSALNMTVNVYCLYGLATKVSVNGVLSVNETFIFDAMFAIVLFIGGVVSLASILRGIVLSRRIVKRRLRRQKTVTTLISQNNLSK